MGIGEEDARICVVTIYMARAEDAEPVDEPEEDENGHSRGGGGRPISAEEIAQFTAMRGASNYSAC
eukprot:11212935-Lingulodinium_polyedra.AAC.1